MGENALKRLIEFLHGSRDQRGNRRPTWFARTRFGKGVIEVLRELESVTWPSKENVRASTVVVLITVAIFAAYAAIWDFIVTSIERIIY